jgi:dGTPase
LERDGEGLNLTWEVREGILKHSKTRMDILGEGWGNVDTLEGEVCKIADSVAYINHDIGDATRAGIIAEKELPHSAISVLGNSPSERINTMVCDIIDYSEIAFEGKRPAVGMSPSVREAANDLRGFLFERVYNPSLASKETERARKVVHCLYEYFIHHEQELPQEHRIHGDTTERSVVDYIAGMTDQFALRMAEELGFSERHQGGSFHYSLVCSPFPWTISRRAI